MATTPSRIPVLSRPPTEGTEDELREWARAFINAALGRIRGRPHSGIRRHYDQPAIEHSSSGPLLEVGHVHREVCRRESGAKTSGVVHESSE